MLAEPTCFTRKCKHFVGARQDENGEDETNERVVCKAFPNGIPDEIVNRH